MKIIKKIFSLALILYLNCAIPAKEFFLSPGTIFNLSSAAFYEKYIMLITLSSYAPDDYYHTMFDRSGGDPFRDLESSWYKLSNIFTGCQIQKYGMKGTITKGVWLEQGYIYNCDEDFTVRVFKESLKDTHFSSDPGGQFNFFHTDRNILLLDGSKFQIIVKNYESLQKLLARGTKEKLFSVLYMTKRYAVLSSHGRIITILIQDLFNRTIYSQMMDKVKKIQDQYDALRENKRWWELENPEYAANREFYESQNDYWQKKAVEFAKYSELMAVQKKKKISGKTSKSS